jgi:hypothetical protein
MDSENIYKGHVAKADGKHLTQGFFKAIPHLAEVHWSWMLATPGL